jgi:hypothetical protein
MKQRNPGKGDSQRTIPLPALRGAVSAYIRNNAIGFMALFVALGGGAYATHSHRVGSKDIRKGAVTTPKIKGQAVKAGKLAPNSVRTGKISDEAVTASKLAPGVAISGPQGAQGPQGNQGQQGPQGPPGPFPGVLPSGETVRGYYYAGGTAAAAEGFTTDSIAFGYQLAAAPQPHFIRSGNTAPAQCPGSAQAPQAQPGHLCVYEGSAVNADARNTTTFVDPFDETALGVGAGVFVRASAAGDFFTQGTWAVTAP